MKKYGTKTIAAGFERREKFQVVIQPQLIIEGEEVVMGDYCVVELLDMNSVSVIASSSKQEQKKKNRKCGQVPYWLIC
jgi:hypothetical protein